MVACHDADGGRGRGIWRNWRRHGTVACLEPAGDLFMPYRLVHADGVVAEPTTAFFGELGNYRAWAVVGGA